MDMTAPSLRPGKLGRKTVVPLSYEISSTGATVMTSTAPTTIGAQAAAEFRHFDGIIDELRISSVVRSSAWLELQHRSMTDDLLVYGDEEAVSDR
jgi:hypothetical protein